MKNLIWSSLIILSISTSNANSTTDIITILEDAKITNVIREQQISRVINLGGRAYQIDFGKCTLIASMVANCIRNLGTECVPSVKFGSENVVCH